jgi:pyrroloquinoline quinone biosynthesis protein E
LTGDGANTDPVCELSPAHHKVAEIIARVRRQEKPQQPLFFRDDANARVLVSS